MSEVGIFFWGWAFGVFMSIVLYFWFTCGECEVTKAKKVLIKYKDGNKEEVKATNWERYDNHIVIYNNNLEDNLLKELSEDCVKSIGFVSHAQSE